MKISRLLPIVCINVFVAAPALASSAPISLCGESKAGKSEKSEQTEATDKSEKKIDKKEKKEAKGDGKASA